MGVKLEKNMALKEVQWAMLEQLVVVLDVLYVKLQLKSRSVEIINDVHMRKNFSKKVLISDFFLLLLLLLLPTTTIKLQEDTLDSFHFPKNLKSHNIYAYLFSFSKIYKAIFQK